MLANGYSRAKRYLTSEGLGPFLVRALAGTGAVRIGSVIASFAVGILLARMLGVDGYGYYGVALSIITIAAIPGELGLPRLVTREIAAADARQDISDMWGVLHWARRVAAKLCALMVVLAALVALAWAEIGTPVVSIVIMMGIPAIPLMALARIDGGALVGLRHVVRGQIPENFLRPAFFSFFLLIPFLLHVRLHPGTAMALNSATAGIVLVIVSFWLKQRFPDGQSRPIRDSAGWLASAIPMALTQGVNVLLIELSTLLIGIISTPTQVGLFKIANVAAVTAAAAVPVVVQVAFPVFARLHSQGDRTRLQKAVRAFAKAQFAGVLLLSLPLLIIPGTLLNLAFGDSFVPASTPLRILLIGQIISAAFGPNVVLLNMTNQERRVTRAMGIALALNLIMLPLLAASSGASGASVALVLSTLCWNLIAWLDAKRLLHINTFALAR